METLVYDLMNSGIAVDLLVPSLRDTCDEVGVRLRPFGKSLPRNKMILASGPTFEEAVHVAADKAETGRWETLDWAARPWSCEGHKGASRFGL